jgi:hypothetical protein
MLAADLLFKHDRHSKYDVKLWRVHMNIAVTETQQRVSLALLLTYTCSCELSKPLSVAMETPECVHFALLSSYRIFRNAVNDT